MLLLQPNKALKNKNYLTLHLLFSINSARYKVCPNYVTLQSDILLEIYSSPTTTAQRILKEQGF